MNLTPLQQKILSDITTHGGVWNYHPVKYGDKAKASKELEGLIEAGLIIKETKRILFNGRYSTKITLKLKEILT